MKKRPKNKNKDPFFGPKWLAYMNAEMPEKAQLDDYVRWAKFQLAIRTKTLLKDPIWDKYTAEEILIEFFAHKFDNDPNFKKDFEKDLGMEEAVVDDFASWADKEMGKAEKDMEKQIEGLEDKISFDPSADSLGDE